MAYKPEELIVRSVVDVYLNPEERKVLVEKLFKDEKVYDYEIVFIK